MEVVNCPSPLLPKAAAPKAATGVGKFECQAFAPHLPRFTLLLTLLLLLPITASSYTCEHLPFSTYSANTFSQNFDFFNTTKATARRRCPSPSLHSWLHLAFAVFQSKAQFHRSPAKQTTSLRANSICNYVQCRRHHEWQSTPSWAEYVSAGWKDEPRSATQSVQSTQSASASALQSTTCTYVQWLRAAL